MESTSSKMDFSNDGHIIPLALRRTHRANAGAKRKQAEEESVKAKDIQKEMKKKKKKRLSASPNVAANSAQSVTKMAADFIRSSKTKVPVPKGIKNWHPHNDFYCWVCHNQRRDGNFLYCNVCPRVYHDTCANLPCPQPDWVCLECEKITDAECTETQSNAMASLTVDKLAKVLRTAIEKMKRYTNSLLFTPIDDLREFRDYRQFVYHPMDLSVMEKNVQNRSYGSTEAFLADAKWIVHNAFVYFGSGNRYSNAAKALLKACETEMAEVELCPDCYLGAVYKRPQWFSEVCTKPHPLVWAKLHGFPFWPAKAMKEEDGLLEARFFGQHDRAMIPVHNCFQYSTKIPFPASKKRLTGLNASIKEAELHIKKLEEKLGTPYKYAPHLTPYDPNRRYTTSSLAVMPDGKVKSLTDAGRNAQMKGKVFKNGEEESKKKEQKKEDMKGGGDDNMDNAVASSVENDKAAGKGDTTAEIKTDSSTASSVDDIELDVTGDTSPSPEKLNHVGMEHSYACRESQRTSDEQENVKQEVENDIQVKSYEFPKENVSHSQEKEEKDEHTDAPDKKCHDHEDEESSMDRKRKLSESHSQQPEKLPRMSSVKDDNLLAGTAGQETEEPDDVDSDKLQAPSPVDTLREVDTCSTESHESPSALNTSSVSPGSKTPVNKNKDSFSILPSRLPSLDDLILMSLDEANVNSSESSSSIPEDDVKSNQSTPRKDTFLMDLSKTIDTCKASLGIEEEMEEEIADEGGKDDEDGMEDADTTGDESMESEVDEYEEAEKEDKQVASTSNDTSVMDEGTEDIEHVGENLMENKENGRVKESKEAVKQGIEAPEDGMDIPAITDNDKFAMDTEDEGDDGCDLDKIENNEMAKSKILEQNERTEEEKKNEEETVKDKKMDEDLAEKGLDASASITKPSKIGGESTPKEPSGLKIKNEPQSFGPSKLKDTPVETGPAQGREGKNDDDDDDDDGGDDDYDDEDSSDGALLIDEGEESGIPNKKQDGTPTKVNSADCETKTGGDAEASPADTVNKKEKIPKEAQLELKQDTVPDKLTGAEAKKEEAKGKESSEKDARKLSGVEGNKVANLSETAKELLLGTPKPVGIDPDYKTLIAKVVDSAVKSFKELDESLADASEDLKKLVLDLKREVISLKAKQELQENELLHCNKLAAAEIRQVMEYSRDCKLNKVKRRFDKQKRDAVFDTKGKQWCASCSQEANYFCCWNTSYCSYDCQERHWIRHEKKCQQKSGNFPFLPCSDFDPYRKKKKKKKRKREEEQAWLREYGFEEESDDGDPTWEPNPEELPTMVPPKKGYTPIPRSAFNNNPKVLNQQHSRTVSQHTPNRTWTQPSGSLTPRSNFKTTSMLSSRVLQGIQQELVNTAPKMNTQTSSKMVYIPRTTVQQNRMPVISQNLPGGQSVIINQGQKPLRFVTCPKNDMQQQSNVVYMGATQAGIQTGVPANLTMQAAAGGSGGIQNQGTPPMPIKLQMGPNKIGMSSLVQALGQPLQQGGKFVIQLTPGQQGGNMQTVKVTKITQPNQTGNVPVVLKNVIGSLPQGQMTPAAIPTGSLVQNLQTVGKQQIMIPRLAPGSAPSPKQIVISLPNVTNTAVSSISVPRVAPVVVSKTRVVGNIAPAVPIQVAAVSNLSSSPDKPGNVAITQDSSNATPKDTT